MTFLEVLEKLSNLIAPSGYEDQVRTEVINLLNGVVNELKVDKLGNVIAYKKGSKNLPTILLAAHMDEVGFIITHIHEDGFLRFHPLGGIYPPTLYAQRVTILGRKGEIPGYIGAKPPHLLTEEEMKKGVEIGKMFIDIGAQSYDEVLEMGVHIGSVGTFATRFCKLNDNKVLGKAFDDRAGLTAMIEVIKALKETDYNIIGIGTVQEEVGLRGARVAAWQTKPDYAIILEGTTASDDPETKVHQRTATQGEGPAITIADKSIIVPSFMIRILEDAAKEENIPYQYKKTITGGTDAGVIHLTREGIPAAVISVPCRYIHSSASILCIKDLENVIALVKAFIKKVSKEHLL